MLTNEHLQARGIAARVDQWTREAQGIHRVPTVHLGPAVSAMERRGIQTEVGKRISLERATERLSLAAELGRPERERQGVERSILDLSGDLAAARAERDRESSAAELSPGAQWRLTPEEVQAESRKRWLQEREGARQSDRPMSLEEIRRQGREGLAGAACGDGPGWIAGVGGCDGPGHKREASSSSAGPQGEKPQEMTLEQIKALGRTEIQGVKQELAAENERERQRRVQLEKEQTKWRTRGKGRFPGDDEGPFGWSR